MDPPRQSWRKCARAGADAAPRVVWQGERAPGSAGSSRQDLAGPLGGGTPPRRAGMPLASLLKLKMREGLWIHARFRELLSYFILVNKTLFVGLRVTISPELQSLLASGP